MSGGELVTGATSSRFKSKEDESFGRETGEAGLEGSRDLSEAGAVVSGRRGTTSVGKRPREWDVVSVHLPV